MKTGYKYLLIGFTTIAMVACKGTTSNNSNSPATYYNNCLTADCSRGTTAYNTSFTGGAVAILNVVNSSVLSQYAGRYVQPTTPIEININTSPQSGVYLGELNIRYSEASGQRMGHFTNGTSTAAGNNLHVLTVDQDTGIPTYRFFFEDPAGVIIVTMQATGAAYGTDTSFATTLDGAVYFRNFNSTAPNPLYQPYTDTWGNYWPSNPLAFCWSGQITVGPYDCRNSRVQPDMVNNHPVVKLGTFTGLDKRTALGL